MNLTKSQQKVILMLDLHAKNESLDPTSNECIILDSWFTSHEFKYTTFKALFSRGVIVDFYSHKDEANRTMWSVMIRPNHIRDLANQILSAQE